jgi:hypothetical protein
MLSKLDQLSKIFKLAVISDIKLQQLSILPSFNQRVKFAKANWPKITSGSSREIFEYSPDKILKLAKNDKGIDQNSVENDNFIQTHYKNIIANVIDSDPDDKWLVVEKASKMSTGQFKSITGIDFLNFCNYIQNRIDNKKYPVKDQEKLDNDEFVYNIVDLLGNFDMPAGDATRKNSWGIINNRAVLVDYGLTRGIYREHYS